MTSMILVFLMQVTVFLPIIANGIGPVSPTPVPIEIGDPIVNPPPPATGEVPRPGQYERHPEIGWPMVEDCREVKDNFPNRIFWDSDDQKVVVCNYNRHEFPFSAIPATHETWLGEEWMIWETGEYQVTFQITEGEITVWRCEWNALGCDAP